MRRRHYRGLVTLAMLLPSCGASSEQDTTPLDEAHDLEVIERGAVVSEPAVRVGRADVLVLTASAGYRHASIADGMMMIDELGRANGFEVREAPTVDSFTELLESDDFEVVVFFNTSGDVLDAGAESALEHFVRSGGGWVGIHAAADAEYDWPFYGQLLGDDAWFSGHPPGTSAATLDVDTSNSEHPSVAHLPASFVWEDEWYAFQKRAGPSVDVLLRLDESSYDAGSSAMGEDHPISWAHRVDSGFSWYTGIGHRPELYRHPDFRQHVLGGIRWAAGRG